MGALAAGAVGRLEGSLLLYPVYFCLTNVALTALILGRRAVRTRRTWVPVGAPGLPVASGVEAA